MIVLLKCVVLESSSRGSRGHAGFRVAYRSYAPAEAMDRMLVGQ